GRLAIGGEDVVVADEAGQAVVSDRDAAVAGAIVEEDVVKDNVAGATVLDVDAPAGIGSLDNRVVFDDIVLGAIGGVLREESNVAGVVVVEQVVVDDRTLPAVAVDARAAASAVIVNDVVLD